MPTRGVRQAPPAYIVQLPMPPPGCYARRTPPCLCGSPCSSDGGKWGGARAEHRVAAAAQRIERGDKVRNGRGCGCTRVGLQGALRKISGKVGARVDYHKIRGLFGRKKRRRDARQPADEPAMPGMLWCSHNRVGFNNFQFMTLLYIKTLLCHTVVLAILWHTVNRKHFGLSILNSRVQLLLRLVVQ
jgi:hypothetical protein